MPNEEEKGEGDGEVGEELCVRGRHAVALAIHLFNRLRCQHPLLPFNSCNFKKSFIEGAVAMRTH